MRNFDTRFVPFIVGLLVMAGIAVYVVTDNQREENKELKRHIAHLESHPLIVETEPDIDCGAALVDANKRYEGAMILLNESYAREKALEKIITEGNRNLKPVQPVRPKPAGRVLKLPEDANTWYSTLFVQTDWQTRPNEANAVRRLNETDWGKDLQAQTTYRIVDVKGDMWTATGRTGETFENVERYYPWVPKTPAIVIQKPSGEIVYRECNPDLAKMQHGLRHQIDKTMKRQRHGNERTCPGPYCKPPDQSQQVPTPDNNQVVVQPDPQEPPPKKDSPVGALLALAASATAAFGIRFRMASS